MIAIPCLHISDSEMTHLEGDLAIGNQCGPHYKTKKVLNQGQSTAVRFKRKHKGMQPT